MSVRRLAEPALQPAAFAFNRAKSAEAKTWIRKYPKGREQSAVIPLLMLAQEQEGWVTKAAIEHVADMLEMPYIRALEVATFYTQFQLKPVGTRAHIQVCGTTPCMLRGSEALMDVCRSKIHHEQFHTNASGTLSWEEVECLGACVNAPMVMIFKDTYEDLTPERLGEIIDTFDAGKGASVTRGPQVDRVYSAPETGLTSLRDEKAVLKSTREREARVAAREAKAAAAVPPSRAAKPKTDASETNAALRSPSRQKASKNGEKIASVKAPAQSAAAADQAEPAVEKTVKQRAHARPRSTEPAAAYKSPELLKGEPLGPDGKRQVGEKRAPRGKPSPEAPGLMRPVGPRSVENGSKPGAAVESAKPSLDDRNRPAAIAKPTKVDDLKLISGVGPRLEGTLHSLGIYTFAQVASWKKAERDWVDGYLNFKGRIERDDWVRQAKALAKGGEAEYIRVFGKKPV